MMIVPLEPTHLEQVEEIEDSDGDVHWERSQFERELSGDTVRFFVVMEEGTPEVLGYGGYWKAGPEAQITNLVVRKEFRRRGIGKRLLEFLIDCARGEMCTTCTLELRQSNEHARSLYKSMGFEVKGTRPRIYEDPVEDAVLMEKEL